MSKQILERDTFKEGDSLKAVNVKPLPGNTVAPPLEEGKNYEAVEIWMDSKGNQHIHVGLESELNYVTSYETGEEIPGSSKDDGKKHFCHPSRFVKNILTEEKKEKAD